MSKITLSPMGDRWDTFEVYHDGVSVGMIWGADGRWHADRLNKANPRITERDKMAAAIALIRALDGEG
jgi:hypothetical protein